MMEMTEATIAHAHAYLFNFSGGPSKTFSVGTIISFCVFMNLTLFYQNISVYIGRERDKERKKRGFVLVPKWSTALYVFKSENKPQVSDKDIISLSIDK